MAGQDRLAGVDSRGRVTIRVLEHQPPRRPVEAGQAAGAIQAGTQGNHFPFEYGFLAREVDGVEQGVDLDTLLLPRHDRG